MGPKLAVVLNDYEAIKEAFLKMGDVFAGRPNHFFSRKLQSDENGVRHGLVTTDGSHWKEQRKFALSALRDFGMGKLSLEGKINEEIAFLQQEIAKMNSAAFDPQLLLGNAVSNVICSIVYGNRFDYDDPEFRNLLRMMDEIFSDTRVFGIINYLPALRFVPGFGGDVIENMVRLSKNINAFHDERVREHRDRFDGETVTDFIDAYLKQIEDERKAGITDTTFTAKEMPYIVGNLFAAGSETTSTTLYWSLLYMINYPDVQRSVQREIEEVVGRGRAVSLKDKPNMPYTEATLMEVQRIATLAPLSIPHATTRAVNFRGYHIPAGTTVFANLWAANHDPCSFPNPEDFDPGRYLDANGKLNNKCDRIVPFSIGWRVCLGEMLAKMELFLFFCGVFQNFDVQQPARRTPPSLKGRMAGSYRPQLCQMHLLPRQ